MVRLIPNSLGGQFQVAVVDGGRPFDFRAFKLFQAGNPIGVEGRVVAIRRLRSGPRNSRDQCPFDQIFQLAHIARIVVVEQIPQGLLGKTGGLAVELVTVFPQAMLRQRGISRFAPAMAGYAGENIEPIIQIAPEPAVFDFRSTNLGWSPQSLASTCRYWTFPDSAKTPILQDLQQLDLQGRTHFR